MTNRGTKSDGECRVGHRTSRTVQQEALVLLNVGDLVECGALRFQEALVLLNVGDRVECGALRFPQGESDLADASSR